MRKLDDRGFSLVELLIAIAILAVIIVPLLHSFVTASNTNAKAKKKLEATMAGQNVFEEIKAMDLDALIQDPDTVKRVALNDDGSAKLDTNGNEIVVLEREFDRSVNGKDYHMIATLDPTSYTTVDGGTGLSTDYNSLGYSRLEDMSASDNAMLTVDAIDREKAANELLLLESMNSEVQQIKDRMTRDVAIKIKSYAGGVTVVTATVTYTDGTYSCTTRSEEEIYNNGMNLKNQLSNVFIFFYPMYNNSTRGMPKETISIDNSENYEVGVYLIKESGDASVSVAEQNNYSVGVHIRETANTPVTTLVTNLGYRDGAGTGNEMQLTYTGGTGFAGGTLSDALHISAGEDGLQRAGTKTKIYDVTIEVYRKKNGGGPVTYEKDDLLTTLEGTKTE